LIVVSALARGKGPFDVSLSARPADPRAAPIVTAQPAVHSTTNVTRKPPIMPEPDARSLPPRERVFHIMAHEGDSSSPRNYSPIRGELRAVGHRVQIYVDPADVDQVSRDVFKELIACFDDQIYPETASRYGTARDVDRDGRFTILLTSWLDHLAGGKHSVDGFIRAADLDTNIPAPLGNSCDMMYLNARLKPSPYLKTILAHEYMHAVVASVKGASESTQPRPMFEEEGWLDEAIAHLAEDDQNFTKANIDYRVSAFLSRPEQYQLVVDDYYAADLFRSHGNRGGTYLFLSWCVNQFGDRLIPTLIRSSRRGIDNIEAATGTPFAELYRRWSIDLFLSGLNDRHTEPGLADHPSPSLTLREPWDDWEMAGPRITRVAPGSSSDAWTQLGTTSHFVVVAASPSGAVDIDVSGPPQAQLQVTAVSLGSQRPRLEASVTPIAREGGNLRVVVRIRECHGVPVRLSAISWEPLTPGPNPHASGFKRGRLDMLGVASSLGTAALGPNAELTSQPIVLDTTDDHGNTVVFKVTGTDPSGHRVSAWAELNPRPDAEPEF
jgi:hypothetical protein